MSFFEDASLVMIPSGVKESKLYSIKPTDGTGDFTFTRGTDTATRVNSAGLIEKETQNLLLQSNQFDTTWTLNNASVTGGQSGYDGSNDAWELDVTTAAGHLQQSLTAVSGVHTISLYAKQGTLDFLMIYARDAGGSNDAEFYFDLANGVTGSTKGANPITLKMTDVGGGWYRCEGASKGGFDQYRIYGSNVDNSVTGTGNIYIQDAQLEQSLVARTYIETTTAAVYAGITDNLPRLDYSGGASCPSLLLEPQRTNLFTQSEYLNGFTTSGSPAPTLTANYAESPEGVDNAYRVEIPSVSGLSLMAQLISHTSGTDMTISAYVKSNVVSDQSFKFFGDYGTGSGTSGTLTATSEWQRFTFTFTPTATGSRNAGILNVANTAADLLVYAMQIETGSYPTSYIPTMGVSATRVKDFINQNIQALTSGLTEGTLFVEFEKPNTGENVDLMRLKGSGASGRAYIYNNGAGFASDWGTSQNFTIGENTKAAWRLDSLSSGVEFVNGVKGAGGSGTAWSDIRLLRFNADGNGGVLKIKQILFFPTALTDAECITLTTL